jgi:hypothetical protein
MIGYVGGQFFGMGHVAEFKIDTHEDLSVSPRSAFSPKIPFLKSVRFAHDVRTFSYV